jgi:hypothetical protein
MLVTALIYFPKSLCAVVPVFVLSMATKIYFQRVAAVLSHLIIFSYTKSLTHWYQEARFLVNTNNLKRRETAPKFSTQNP